MQQGIFRAVELLTAMETEIRRDVINLGVDQLRAERLKDALASLVDQQALGSYLRGVEAGALARAGFLVEEAGHEDPTVPNSTVIEVKLGQDD